eukprot:6492280-Amphidinium_carterae.11
MFQVTLKRVYLIIPCPPQPSNHSFCQEVGIEIVDRLGCDRKEAVLTFLKQNPNICPMHISPEVDSAIEATSGGNNFVCSRHGEQCAFREAEKRGCATDLFVAGPPCSPYSTQRSGRSMLSAIVKCALVGCIRSSSVHLPPQDNPSVSALLTKRSCPHLLKIVAGPINRIIVEFQRPSKKWCKLLLVTNHQ